jgi:hypothetical protein
MNGNVTSLLPYLGSESMVQFKSKLLHVLLKLSRSVDQMPIRNSKGSQPEAILEFTIVCVDST